jgi:ADP-ribosylglycohydrolase
MNESDPVNNPDGDRLPHPLFLTPDTKWLAAERHQSRTAGRDIEHLQSRFDELLTRENPDPDAVRTLAARARSSPLRTNYVYSEPSTLDKIKRAAPSFESPHIGDPGTISEKDTIQGGLMGAIAGCLLGSPVQGWSRERIHGFLQESNQYPIERFLHADVADSVINQYNIFHNIEATGRDSSTFINHIEKIPPDDDIDYTFVNIRTVETCGAELQTEDIGTTWIKQLPALRTYTAERVAYRNLLDGISPPETGLRDNPYREHIGALIRGPIWGLLCLGEPTHAATFAVRDALLSHVKNGIYAELWVAVLTAIAPLVGDLTEALRLSLSFLPAESRLAASLRSICNSDASAHTQIKRIHQQWDESIQREWSHALPNAALIAIALDHADSITEALGTVVQSGFDTDSHAAVVGAVYGAHIGAASIPSQWRSPFSSPILSGLSSEHSTSIEALTQRAIAASRRIKME